MVTGVPNMRRPTSGKGSGAHLLESWLCNRSFGWEEGTLDCRWRGILEAVEAAVEGRRQRGGAWGLLFLHWRPGSCASNHSRLIPSQQPLEYIPCLFLHAYGTQKLVTKNESRVLLRQPFNWSSHVQQSEFQGATSVASCKGKRPVREDVDHVGVQLL